MNWVRLRNFPWLDTRAGFVARTPDAGTLLDLGSSDGETLRHFAELRPDLKLFSADKAGRPESYPSGCQFHRVDFESDKLPWPDRSMDAITCMQLIEHLNDFTLLLGEVTRVLKPGARAFFETPHPKSLQLPSAAGKFTLNFYDDPTHIRPVPIEVLTDKTRAAGLELAGSGISRNWLFAALWPIYWLLPPSRKKFTSRVHWLGWSAYLIARKPQ